MTIKDIAAMAGVSPGTVSKVLNNKADSITEETREKVLRIVKEYNFKPFQKYIRNDSSFGGLVGVLVPGETGEYADFISGAQAAASEQGYGMILCPCHSEAELEKNLNTLFVKGVDGAALYLDRDVDLKSLFAGAPEKLVYAAASCTGALAAKSAVYCDISAAVKLAAGHLIELGHREIALIGWRDGSLSREFTDGYSEELYAHGIVPKEETVFLCDGPEDVLRAVQQFTYGSGTAFLCQDDRAALCVRRALARYGLLVPRDYSVVGLSPRSERSDVFAQALTVVDLRHRELGRTVMESLILRIEGRPKEQGEALVLEPELCVGGTSDEPPYGTGGRIVVVGSMNMDVIIHMSRIPTSGESLRAERILNLPGGKGANQAVGAAKLGGRVYAIGCLGGDQEGRLLYSSLIENGVNTKGVRVIHEKPTGKAYILVAENGDSTIVLARGANDDLLPELVRDNAGCFDGALFCLISTEMPWKTVLYTLDLCASLGVRTVVKPTVQRVIPPEVLKKITYLVPNEKELEVQVSGGMSVEEKAQRLFESGAENVIVTLGEQGCYVRSREIARRFPAADFQAVDTTGAGDAFISAMAVSISEGHDLASAVRFATYAAGLSTTRDGVQPALADRMAVELYAEQYN